VTDLPDLPDRPAPPQSPMQRAVSWLQWVGPGRVVGGAVVVLAVVAGAYWLVRPPSPSPESTLPFAGTATTVAASSTSAAVSASTVATDTVVVAGQHRLQKDGTALRVVETRN
jgi:hypothetical protein